MPSERSSASAMTGEKAAREKARSISSQTCCRPAWMTPRVMGSRVIAPPGRAVIAFALSIGSTSRDVQTVRKFRSDRPRLGSRLPLASGPNRRAGGFLAPLRLHRIRQGLHIGRTGEGRDRHRMPAVAAGPQGHLLRGGRAGRSVARGGGRRGRMPRTERHPEQRALARGDDLWPLEPPRRQGARRGRPGSRPGDVDPALPRLRQGAVAGDRTGPDRGARACLFTMHEYFLACPNGGFFDLPEPGNLRPAPARAAICLTTNCDARKPLTRCGASSGQAATWGPGRMPRGLRDIAYISKVQLAAMQRYLPDEARLYHLPNPVAAPRDGRLASPRAGSPFPVRRTPQPREGRADLRGGGADREGAGGLRRRRSGARRDQPGQSGCRDHRMEEPGRGSGAHARRPCAGLPEPVVRNPASSPTRLSPSGCRSSRRLERRGGGRDPGRNGIILDRMDAATLAEALTALPRRPPDLRGDPEAREPRGPERGRLPGAPSAPTGRWSASSGGRMPGWGHPIETASKTACGNIRNVRMERVCVYLPAGRQGGTDERGGNPVVRRTGVVGGAAGVFGVGRGSLLARRRHRQHASLGGGGS